MTESKESGKVYLIGAGPGDPELITVKGLRLAHQCDVVLYDSLIPDEIMVTLPQSVERVFVGKRGGRHSMEQEDINRLLLEYANAGKSVARLKGADPLIFGRGAEEAQFLRDNGIEFEIVPGVTAGIAGPSYAGIPCTERHLASTLIFVTGHRAQDKSASSVDWKWLASARKCTIVVYMGVGQIDVLTARLIDNGMPSETPAAIIERGTMSSQRIFVSDLSELPDTVRRNEVHAPALFVIGEVVKLRERLEWFRDLPLIGKRVMVTRPSHQAVETYQRLRELGAEVLPYPTIKITGVENDSGWSEFDRLSEGEKWLVFTSENGVEFFVQQFLGRGNDVRQLAGFKVAAVGKGTARALQRHHINPDFVPETATVAVFADEFTTATELKGVPVVRVRGNLADETFESTARDAGAEVVPVEVYKTGYNLWPEGLKEKLLEYPPDAVMFTSGSTVEGLFENLDESELEKLLGPAAIFSIGPSTTAKLRAHGLTVARECDIHNIDELVGSILDYFTH